MGWSNSYYYCTCACGGRTKRAKVMCNKTHDKTAAATTNNKRAACTARSRAHGGALSWQAVPPPPAKVSLPRPRLRVLATPCAARTTATSRTSRGAGALGPEAPAEQQEEAVGRDGRATRVSAHARARSAVLEGWVWAHPSTEARSGWREARSEHVISSPSRSAGQSSAQRRCRSTGVRGGKSVSAAS